MLVKLAPGELRFWTVENVTYQNRVNRSSPIRVHEGGELLVDVTLAAAVDGERLDLTAQPLVDLVVPVLHQTARCNNDGLVYQRLAVGTLPGQ